MKKLSLIAIILTFIACHSSKKVTTTPSEEVVVETPEPKTKTLHYVDNKSTTLSQVLEQAKKENKLVFIDAYATWCAPCKIMEKEVFNQASVVNVLEKDFIPYKVNIEKNTGPTVSLLYSIDVLPTLLFLDADGNVLVRQDGAVAATRFTDLMKKAIAKK